VDKTKEIVTELKRSYAIELETMQNYLANSIDLEGTSADPIKKSLEDEVALKLKHARRLAKRIHVLGGRLPVRWNFRGIRIRYNRRWITPTRWP
jgi:bacterioferritin